MFAHNPDGEGADRNTRGRVCSPGHAAFGSLIALFVALFVSAAHAQEGSVHYEYVLDDQTELSLDSHPNDPKTWTMGLRQYGGPEQRLLLNLAADLRQIAPGRFEYKADGDKPKTVWVNGKPGLRDETLELSMRNVAYDDLKPAHIHGIFKPVDPILREVRTKERFQKADAALNEAVNRVLAEVGKGGEEKLREVQRQRIALRDERAKPYKGTPDEPMVAGPYWESMWMTTLESIAFLKTYTGRTVAKGIAGSYRDPTGCALDLTVADETATVASLTFTITTPRPAGEKPGTMTGVARLYGTRAVYKEALGKKETANGREPAELVFSLRAGHIVVVEAKNTDEYTGPGVSLNGDYYKVAPPRLP